MCGRFIQTLSPEEICELFEVEELPPALLSGSGDPSVERALLPPRYNLAPSQDAAVVRNAVRGESPSCASGREIAMLRWGLVPGGAESPGSGPRPINARAETAHSKPTFRDAFRSRRCLVPVNGFYEWTRMGRARQPWLIRMDEGAPFALAGLWERWQPPPGSERQALLPASPPASAVGAANDALETFTILTTEANDVLAPIHDRMPVIVPRDRFEPWLAGEDVPLAPYPPESRLAERVSTRVNNPANDDPTCLTPATEPPATPPPSLFGRG